MTPEQLTAHVTTLLAHKERTSAEYEAITRDMARLLEGQHETNSKLDAMATQAVRIEQLEKDHDEVKTRVDSNEKVVTNLRLTWAKFAGIALAGGAGGSGLAELAKTVLGG